MPFEYIDGANAGAPIAFNDGGVPEALERIEEEILCHPIVRHPFLETLKAGKYSKNQVRAWIGQQFYFSTQFPRCLAALYARLDDFEASKSLMDFLAVEHWGSKSEGAHWKQYSRTLAFFDLQIDDLRNSEPLPETRKYLDYRLALCLERTVEEALGVIGFGHELINQKIFQSYLDGISKIDGIPAEAVTYFRVHVRDEPDDYRVLKELMFTKGGTPEAIDRMRSGAENVLRARYTFFDQIQERLDAVR